LAQDYGSESEEKERSGSAKVTERVPHDDQAWLHENLAAWEDWSHVDPLWAIVTEEERAGERWDVDAFFSSGRATIDALWRTAATFGIPRNSRTGLDFGCGAGRLTRGLGEYLDRVLGLDISPGMVDLARRYNASYPNLAFEVHREADLHGYPDGSFDVVCSLLVLQHIPSVVAIERYLRDFVRVTASGGVLMLQLTNNVHRDPSRKGFRARLRPRTRLARSLRAAGVSARLLHRYLGWQPAMPMLPIAHDRVCEILIDAGATIRWTCPRSIGHVDDCLYLATSRDR
jgi:SAM-dependent methyltransferase